MQSCVSKCSATYVYNVFNLVEIYSLDDSVLAHLLTGARGRRTDPQAKKLWLSKKKVYFMAAWAAESTEELRLLADVASLKLGEVEAQMGLEKQVKRLERLEGEGQATTYHTGSKKTHKLIEEVS